MSIYFHHLFKVSFAFVPHRKIVWQCLNFYINEIYVVHFELLLRRGVYSDTHVPGIFENKYMYSAPTVKSTVYALAGGGSTTCMYRDNATPQQ